MKINFFKNEKNNFFTLIMGKQNRVKINRKIKIRQQELKLIQEKAKKEQERIEIIKEDNLRRTITRAQRRSAEYQQKIISLPKRRFLFSRFTSLRDLHADFQIIHESKTFIFSKSITLQMFKNIFILAQNNNLLTYLIFNGKMIKLHEDNLEDLLTDIKNGYTLINGHEYEPEVNYNINDTQFLLKFDLKETIQRKKASGAFFNYYLNEKIDLDLTDLNIYKNFEEYEAENIKHCLLKALSFHLTNEELNKISFNIKTKNISITNLKQIADELNIIIKLQQLRNITDNNKQANKSTKYGTTDKNKKIIELVFFEEHYFINSTHSIEDFRKVKADFKKPGNRFILSSFQLIKLIFEENGFTKIPAADKFKTPYHNKQDHDEDDLYEEIYTDNDLMKKSKETDTPEPLTLMFDVETFEDENNELVPYLSSIYFNDAKKIFYGKNCILDQLNYVTKIKRLPKQELHLKAHNLKFDNQFFAKYLKRYNSLEKDGNLYSAEGYFNNVKIKFTDTYKIIPDSLKNFGKMFKLKQEKEYIIYQFYNDQKEKLFTQEYFNLNEILEKYFIKKIVTKELKKQIKIDTLNYNKKVDENKALFLENLKKFECFNPKNLEEVNMMKYSGEYCLIDSEVLYKGYHIFKGWISNLINVTTKKKLNINIDKKLTISGIAELFSKLNDVYDGVTFIKNSHLNFIQKTVRGGRVISYQNKKIDTGNPKVISKENNNKERQKSEANIEFLLTQDLDAVSLYLTAMSLLPGFLKGYPKIISKENLNLKFLNTVDHYYIKIKINDVKKYRDLPLISKKDENDVLEYSNEIRGIIYVDKYYLEDLIKFQKIEYEILSGLYFNEGFNTKIIDVTKYLKKERDLLKADKNPANLIYKLIGNSLYGRTIQRENDTKKTYFDNEKDAKIYLTRNEKNVKSYTVWENNYYKSNSYIIETKEEIHTHKNMAHIGSMILSMSKRIMNKVICLAEDNDIKILYQDTDSMHIFDHEINRLAELYFNEYNEELLGEELGQFKTDFNLENSTDPVSIRTMILGKKVYYDKLQDRNNTEIFGEHFRCKGIPAESIYDYSYINNLTIEEIFEQLLSGKTLKFNMLAGGKISLRFTKDFKITSSKEFYKEIKF